MSSARRVQQWLTFSRKWWLFDAKWQDPYKSAECIANYLKGAHKPIFGGPSDCGDHVIVTNSQDIAMKGDDWYYRVYFHHTGYPGGASWTKAYELHQKDPTMIIWKGVYKALGGNPERRQRMARLHIFKDDKVKPQLQENITDQIRALRPIPKRLNEFSKKEIEAFPQIWEYPQDYVLK